MTSSTVDLEFLARQTQKSLDELRSMRKELSDVRSPALQTVEYSRRVERRVSEMRDDIELMVKAEIGGGFAHMHTALDHSISRLADQVEAVAERVNKLQPKS